MFYVRKAESVLDGLSRPITGKFRVFPDVRSLSWLEQEGDELVSIFFGSNLDFTKP